MAQRIRYRTIWISDLHLGTRDSKVAFLLDFLEHHDADHLYLVGDVFDGWALSRSWYWEPCYNDVLQELLRRARQGTKVTYVPGNHDAFARGFVNITFGGIAVCERAIHRTADGCELLVLHGDEFDGVVKLAPWLARLGAWAYLGALRLNRWTNAWRLHLGKPYWSLSGYLKHRAKRAAQYIDRFEETVAREAHQWEVDGVVCGHIHHAELRCIGDVLYANTGDWVESCTALVEHPNGRLEVISWIAADPPTREVVSQSAGDGAVSDAVPEIPACALRDS